MADGTRPRRADSLAAEANFRVRLEELGATLLEPAWLGAQVPHRVICRGNHSLLLCPANLNRPGRGICITCAGKDPRVAEAAFRAGLAEMGATPLFGAYLGRNTPHPVRDRAGHVCKVRPGDLKLRGRVPCRVCSGLNPAGAKAAFYARMAELGAVVLGEYKNAQTKVPSICPAGHECQVSPPAVQQGRGMCGVCGGKDRSANEATFRARLAELGITPLFAEYVGTDSGHRCRCAAGHICFPRPHGLQDGEGACFTCGGKDARVAEAAFRARLAELGAELVEPYVNNRTPVLVRCAKDHLSRPVPGPVIRGGGACRFCAGTEHDAFYVVSSGETVKFGISTGDASARLRVHAARGYTDIVRLVTDLPGTSALDTEYAVKAALALAGEKPAEGREYFPESCLALILDVADSWLAVTAA